MKKDDTVYLQHIAEAIEHIEIVQKDLVFLKEQVQTMIDQLQNY